MANVRVVFEPSVYAIHGPVRGDVSQKEYRWTRSLLDHYMEMNRKGLPECTMVFAPPSGTVTSLSSPDMGPY
jgi:hypothetical protein